MTESLGTKAPIAPEGSAVGPGSSCWGTNGRRKAVGIGVGKAVGGAVGGAVSVGEGAGYAGKSESLG